MTNEIPKVGQLYVSKDDPRIRFYVEEVHEFMDDDEIDVPFALQVCEERHKGLPGEVGYEMDSEEWAEFVQEHGLILSVGGQ